MNVQDIPIHELLEDRAASILDIALCERCIALGITHHRDGFPVAERLEKNKRIVEKIDAELLRRNQTVEKVR